MQPLPLRDLVFVMQYKYFYLLVLKQEFFRGAASSEHLDPAGLMNNIRNGTVNITVIGSSYFTELSPELNVLDIPFLFPSRETAFKVLDSPTGKYLLGTLEKVNIKELPFWDSGFSAMSKASRCVLPDIRCQ